MHDRKVLEYTSHQDCQIQHALKSTLTGHFDGYFVVMPRDSKFSLKPMECVLFSACKIIYVLISPYTQQQLRSYSRLCTLFHQQPREHLGIFHFFFFSISISIKKNVLKSFDLHRIRSCV